MTIAIFQNETDFVFYRVRDDKIREREIIRCAPGGAEQLSLQLVSLQTDLLISGAIPPDLEAEIIAKGIHLIRDCRGEPDRLLSQYLKGELL